MKDLKYSLEYSEQKHPNVQPKWSTWSEEQTLHVVAPYSNYFRWRTRRELMNNFRHHAESSPNVRLWVVEAAYGDRPHEVTTPTNPQDIQLRTGHNTAYGGSGLGPGFEGFSKENLGNVGFQHLSRVCPGWRYGALIDTDFHLSRHDWALEAVHQLQHWDWLQLFSSYVDVSGQVYGMAQTPVRFNSGFVFNYIQNGYQISPQYANGKVKKHHKHHHKHHHHHHPPHYDEGEFMRGVGATGGAIAFRRSAYDAVGGFLDRCIAGHSDWYQMFGLFDIQAPDIHSQNYHPHYKSYVEQWRTRARALRKNVGYVDGFAIHHFHGSKTRRAYSSRDVILARHQYSPYEDVWPDHQGILQLNPDKTGLRDDLRQYFISRSEDDPNLYDPERILV